MEQIALSCDKCKRSLSIKLEVLKRVRLCSYCGAALCLPPELAARLAETGAAPARPALALRVGCTVCGRALKIAAADAGKPSKCQFCGARFLVPASSGPGLDLPVQERPFGKSLEESARKPADSKPLTLLTWQALRSRWGAGTVSTEEAARLVSWLDALSLWKGPGAAVSPLSPHVTIGVVRYLVLKAPGSDAILEPDGNALLKIPLQEGDGSPLSLGPSTELILANVVGLGLLAATGHGFIVTGRKEEEERARTRPALWLKFRSGSGGTVLDCLFQNHFGDRSPLEADKAANMAETIRSGFAARARGYIAFRALYGDWATPDTYTAASREIVAARVAGIPELASEAADLVAMLLAAAK